MRRILSRALLLSSLLLAIGLLYWVIQWFINLPYSGVQIITAKSIITMDEAQPRVEAVATQNGMIIGRGTLDELLQQWPESKQSHFPNQILTPGFIENHLHPAMAALLLPFEWITPFAWDLPNKSVPSTQGEENYRQRLRAIADSYHNKDDSEWLITWGFHSDFHGEMSRELLDQLVPDRPALVWHRSFHEIWLNSKALALGDISAEELESVHGVDIDNGHFYETGLELALVKFKNYVIKPGRFMDGMEQVVDVVHSGGITTIADMAAGMFDMTAEWWAMKWELDDRQTPFRTRLVPMVKRIGDVPGSPEAIAEAGALLEKGNDQLKYVKQVKLLADGAFYSLLMQMRNPGYLDGHSGEWLTPPAELEELASTYWKAGYQLHIHTNGDLGTDVVLSMINRLQTQWPREDHRTTLHHLGYIGPDQAEKIAALDVLVSANPYYLHTLGESYSQRGLGPQRARNIFRGRDLLDAGVSLSLHSDFCMAPAQPLKLAWVAVNREGAGGSVMAKEQQISVHEAMKAITIDAAYAIRMEDQVGSIEVGKFADFAILDEDPYQAPKNRLKDIPVWGTIYKGEVFPIETSQ
ncbi:amidohydrolase [Parendozoicomonas haliclonae]|uniref:N-substituted formamide deformylase n=1 Tax=Parendozoicomonas haliclonae TaxID=1960125 RepID=A0A1X7AI60_9GAMM|nr:amidohydrolase [Parendozoicomonas haliclonae]SMA43894.1 N-substituted formamide deformylase precursor [Parendozoicomonas haliclonae]